VKAFGSDRSSPVRWLNGEYTGLAISTDGRYGYFSFFSENNAVPTLTRVELSGDHMQDPLGIDTDDAVSFSPDGRRLAYVETHTSTKEIDVMIANAEGGDRSVLLKTIGDSRIIPYFRSAPLAWSTDGTTIACVVREQNETGVLDHIILIDANSGNERYLTERGWMKIDSLGWVAQNKLAFIGSEPDSRSRGIWVISIDTGEARSLTDDQFDYEWLSAGKGELLAVQERIFQPPRRREIGVRRSGPDKADTWRNWGDRQRCLVSSRETALQLRQRRNERHLGGQCGRNISAFPDERLRTDTHVHGLADRRLSRLLFPGRRTCLPCYGRCGRN
jgi:Tol biopolymer transport system component